MKQTKHHLKKHVKHHKHKHEKTVSVGRGGLYVPGQNWWGPMMCGVGLCSGVGGGDHEHNESQEQESQEHDGTASPGGEAGESGAVTISGGGDSAAAGM